MTKHVIFLVSDDDGVRRVLHNKLDKGWGHTVRDFANAELAIAAIEQSPDLIVIDLAGPDVSPVALFKELRSRAIEVPLIVLAVEHELAAAVQALKLGAADYLEKPLDATRVETVFRHVFSEIGHRAEILRLREESLGALSDATVVAESREMQLVLRLAEKVKDRDIPVLLTGEKGSGKETIARSLHARGKRKNKPYIAFSYSSVPEDLLAGELFGFEKGSIPGSTQRKSGVFEQANGGSVYIDEIANLDADLQARLLHLIVYKEVKAVGSDRTTRVDVRILAGTSHNLRDMVRKKQFRSDLYYHLASFPMYVPPLRERGTDIVLLAEKLLVRHASEAAVSVKGFSREALEAIYHYPWPGNVEELDSAIRRAVSIAQGDIIGLQHLPIAVLPFKDASMDLETEGKLFHDNKIVPLDKIKEQAVRRAIEIARGNLAQTARELDISRSTLYKLIEKYKISL